MIVNDGSPTFFRAVQVSSPLDIFMITSRLPKRVRWSVDIETRGSNHLPTYISISGFDRSKITTHVHRIIWDLFKEALHLACPTVDTCGSFEDLVTSTMAHFQ